jgi:hypothetical protein
MIKSDERIDKALEEITTNLVKWRMLKRLASSLPCISCATQPATMTAESYSWLHATIEQSNVSVEELIYLGLTRVSGAFGDGSAVVR